MEDTENGHGVMISVLWKSDKRIHYSGISSSVGRLAREESNRYLWCGLNKTTCWYFSRFFGTRVTIVHEHLQVRKKTLKGLFVKFNLAHKYKVSVIKSVKYGFENKDSIVYKGFDFPNKALMLLLGKFVFFLYKVYNNTLFLQCSLLILKHKREDLRYNKNTMLP